MRRSKTIHHPKPRIWLVSAGVQTTCPCHRPVSDQACPSELSKKPSLSESTTTLRETPQLASVRICSRTATLLVVIAKSCWFGKQQQVLDTLQVEQGKLERRLKNSSSVCLHRNVLVCSAKFASTFCELKNRTWGRKMIDLLSQRNDFLGNTIATRVATSTESTSWPKIIIFGCCNDGWLFDGLARGFVWPPDAFENEFLWLEFADPGCWYETLWKNWLLNEAQDVCFAELLLYCDVSEIVSCWWKQLLVRGSLIRRCHWTYSLKKSF